MDNENNTENSLEKLIQSYDEERENQFDEAWNDISQDLIENGYISLDK